jgi:filamentous hemagglutinin
MSADPELRGRKRPSSPELSLYLYGKANPIRFRDPDGRDDDDMVEAARRVHQGQAAAIQQGFHDTIEPAAHAGLSLIPGVGQALNASEAVTGKSFTTGEGVTGSERAMAAVAATPAGFWGKALSRISRWLGLGSKLATAPVEKFSDYIFKEGATHGKDAVFQALGYAKEDSPQLAKLWEEQAAVKFGKGDYTMGKLDQYGQRINIEIEVPGIGDSAGQTSHMRSGWMIQKDGSIKLNTPFSGFTR